MSVQASGHSTSHVSSESDERRIEELFRKLDVNRDGRIDIHDLREALHRLEVPQLPGHAQVSETRCIQYGQPILLGQLLMHKYVPCCPAHSLFEVLLF